MHPYQERDGGEDRKPGGKTRLKEKWKTRDYEEDELNSTKRKDDIHNHSGDSR